MKITVTWDVVLEGYKAGEGDSFYRDTHFKPPLLSVFSFRCISQLLGVE